MEGSEGSLFSVTLIIWFGLDRCEISQRARKAFAANHPHGLLPLFLVPQRQASLQSNKRDCEASTTAVSRIAAHSRVHSNGAQAGLGTAETSRAFKVMERKILREHGGK